MIEWQLTRQVDRSAEHAFDVIGTNMYENHPRWEKEVVEIRPLTPGPVGVGSRAVMVRQEFGRRSETEYEITEFEPGRRIAAFHPDAKMDFFIAFELDPIDADSCTIQVDVRAELQGWMRILEPVMRRVMPKQAARIADDMASVIESTPVRA